MADDSIQSRLEQEAGKALIQNAFFRWESAVMISGAILLTAFVHPFAGWPIWAWPVLGLIGEIAIVASSLTDEGERQRIIDSLFREKYNTSGIRDRELRAKLEQAEQYRARIQAVVQQQPKGVLRDRVSGTANQVYDWIANMVKLARGIDTFRNDPVIQRDCKRVPDEITELQRRLALERDTRTRDQMNATLGERLQWKTNLDELDGRMKRADLGLDHSLASLGTVYSQLLLVGSRDVDSDAADRLRTDARDEVLKLQDLVDSLNEVYSYQTQTTKAMTSEMTPEEVRRLPREDSARR